MRRGDQLSLRKAQVDFHRDVVWVPNSKTGREYPVPMSPEVREVMLEVVRRNPESD
jgi:integrase